MRPECSAGAGAGRPEGKVFSSRTALGPGRVAPRRPLIYEQAPMLRHAIRELRRHAVRSSLTAVGIAIGVAALVLLGALSERMSRLVEGGPPFGPAPIPLP